MSEGPVAGRPPSSHAPGDQQSPATREMRSQRDGWLAKLDFDQAPFTIAWEVTRACAYACNHCRADAQPARDRNELNTDEAMHLIDQLAAFDSKPILVLTGGDPLMRRDLTTLAAHANEQGLRVSLTPTATALVTTKRMHAIRAAGIRRVAFSLDAPDAATHDAFRGFPGSFDRTLAGLRNATAAGLSIQVNTTVYASNADSLKQMVPLLEELGVVQWSVFFLVPTGRGTQLQMLSAEGHERTLNWLYDLAQDAPFDVKATAAPQYRRIAHQRANDDSPAANAGAGYQFADGLNRPAKGVNDGRGFMFISHTGEVMPSGFLPISAGNVRTHDPVELYRDSPLFKCLRNPALLKGKCGRCEFKVVCGGSRARAYGVTGNYLAADPSCSYNPPATQRRVA
ncbi:MAG: TIGR04053 family radical SAM/SPASM domain-containing protein [Thermoleophilaceae bacterium]|nr:TIGR04053 family radical SAM/SPASM domain-containing protein [Thermoleophilaceae bacterium]